MIDRKSPFSRALVPGQRSVVNIGFIDGRAPMEIFSTSAMIVEAPSWNQVTNDLVVNGDGALWLLDADGVGGLRAIDAPGLPDVNNDHVLASDGVSTYASGNDGHLYEVWFDGRPVRRVTDSNTTPTGNRFMHFLHGVSPDRSTLAFIGIDFPLNPDGSPIFQPIVSDVYTIPAAGGSRTRITNGPGSSDGSEYSPDGQWIYYNTENFSSAPGHAQIARMRTDGSGIEQLTFDARVNWFPHLAPTGTHALYLSFPPGTLGHPANLPVELKLVTDGNWGDGRTVVGLFGGQGTINVNSWSPDGTRFAYVSYPVG
jgi:TolB protein